VRLGVVLALLAGCGGSGSAKPPAGYATYRTAGVSFAYPGRFRATSSTVEDLRQVRFAAPGAPERGAPFVLVGVQPGQKGAFDSIVAQTLAVIHGERGRTQVTAVKVPGAVKATRMTIDGRGPRGVPVHDERLDLELRDGTHFDLTAGTPRGRAGAVDIDAVLSSVRVEGGS
jgi:hypothetical protein